MLDANASVLAIDSARDPAEFVALSLPQPLAAIVPKGRSES